MLTKIRRVFSRAPRLLAAAVVAGVAVIALAVTVSAAGSGLLNPGFEEGLLHWTSVKDSLGDVAVTGTETASTWSTYASMGNPVVAPLTGMHMARLGTPKDKNNHEVRGNESVVQTFTVGSGSLRMGFRAFSWEARLGRGSFIVDVRRVDDGTSVGSVSVASPAAVSGWKTIPTGRLPFTLGLDTAGLPYLDTGWITLDITGLPVGQSVVLSYSLTATHDASHDSWVYVDAANTPPVADAQSVSLDEDASLPITLTGSDPDSDTITYSIVSGPSHGSLAGAAPNVLYTPFAHYNGSDSFIFAVTDSAGAVSTATVSITVRPVNYAPVLGAIGNKAVDEAKTLSFVVSATDVDPEDVLVYSATGVPSGATFDTSTHVFSWTPTYDQSGAYPGVTFYVSDGHVTVSETITITVNDVNRPPVAVIQYGPQQSHEGDAIGLLSDASSDPDTDTGDAVASQSWTVTCPDGKTLTSTDKNFLWIAPNNGSYLASLTVTDTHGATDTTTQVISVDPFAPLVNAVNAEVLAGGSAPVMARTLDQGWLDDHTATWNLPGTTPGGVADDHSAALSSGIVTATVSAGSAPVGAVIQGTLAVADAADPSVVGTDGIQIRVVANDPNAYETSPTVPNLTDLSSIPTLAPDWSYLSWIQQPGDVDVYQVLGAGGQPLKQGTQVLVSLKNLPTDYDLVVLATTPTSETTSSLQAAPLGVAAWSHYAWSHYAWSHYAWSHYAWSNFAWSHYGLDTTAWSNFAWSHYAWSHYAWSNYAWSHYDWSNSAWSHYAWSNYAWSNFQLTGTDLLRDPQDHSMWTHVATAWSQFGRNGLTDPAAQGLGPWQSSYWNTDAWTASPLNGYPFDQMSYTGADGSSIGGADIDAGELGLDLEGTNLHVVGSSANRGNADEVVLTTTQLPTTKLYVAVVGHNGSFSAQPYRLQIEESRPSDLIDVAAHAVAKPPLLDAPADSSVTSTDKPLTLFVTQKERIAKLYGQGPADTLMTELAALSANPKVKGVILSVANGADFNAWDTDPNNVDAANTVADDVRTAIRVQLFAHPTIKYVVVVGDDQVIPFRRVVDETVISNESQYYTEAGVTVDSPLFASMYGGNNLTDDFYVDDLPTPWQGRELYLPDRAISRLVETPAEMDAQIDRFMAADGVLQSKSAMISGYDFMVDGANRVGDIFAAGNMTVTTMTAGDWTAADLKAGLLTSPHDVNSPNAHYTHYAAISAEGFHTAEAGGVLDTGELLTSTDVQNDAGGLAARLVMTMGCHAGLSVPDASALPADASSGLNPALDFAQAVSGQGGVLVGSTGYGLGDTDGIAGTESLMCYFASKATSGGKISVGEALAQAKKSYIMGLSAVTVYDEKSAIQFEMYGLPQWSLPVTSTDQYGGGSGSANAAASLSLGAPAGTFTLSTQDGASASTTTVALREVTVPNGNYYTADGDAQFTALRPVQPRVVIPLAGGDPVHGVIYTSSAYDTHAGFDPVIPRPQTEWEASSTEPAVAVDSWWPNEPAVVNNDQSQDGHLTQTLVVNPGQFKPDERDPNVSTKVIGTERLYSQLSIKLLRSSNTTDWVAPTVTDVRIRRISDTSVVLLVRARDASGIGLISVVDFSGTSSGGADFTGSKPPIGDWYEVPVTVAASTDLASLVVQVCDTCNNVTTVTHKSEEFSPIVVTLTPATPDYLLGVPVTFEARIQHYDSLRPPVWYDVDFADGTRAGGVVTTVSPDGTATVTFDHTFLTPATGPIVFSVSDSSGLTNGASVELKEIVRTPATHVAPNGNDVTGDGSTDHPFQSIHMGLLHTSDGGTVYLDSGVYSDNVTFDRQVSLQIEGSATVPPTITAAAPKKPIISVIGVMPALTIANLNFDGTGTTNGLISVSGSNVVLSRCTFTGGTSSSGAGNLAFTNSDVTVDRCTVAGNSGGGVVASGGTLCVINSVVAKNSGGGVVTAGTIATFTNDTVADNSSSTGGGIAASGIAAKVFNCILSGNTAGSAAQQAVGCSIGYSYVGPNADESTMVYGTGMLRASAGIPGFVDAAAGDYRLLPAALCVDAGAPSWSGLTAPGVDRLSLTRPTGFGFDMGAYENQNPAASLDDIYVSKSGSDSYPGSINWPKLTVQAGIGAVNPNGRVHVFAGTYTQNLTIGKPLTLLSESGSLAATIAGTGTDCVVKISVAGVTVDGFVITGGKSATDGGGINLSTSGATTVKNCSITANSATGSGGGIYAGSASLRLLNTTLSNNTAQTGGAAAFHGGTIFVEGARAISNSSSADGGAFDLLDTNFTISRSLFQFNSAVGYGGAVALHGASGGSCENSILDSNSVSGSMSGGGAFTIGTSPVTLVNDTMTRNRAYWGSALTWGNSPVTVFNCIMWKNSSTKSQFSAPNSRTLPAPSYSFVDDSSAKFNNNIGGIKSDPGLVDITKNDFRLTSTSICIDKGASRFNSVDAPTQDYIGNARPNGLGWDIGAYEFYAK